MYRVAICDDDQNAIHVLAEHITVILQNLSIEHEIISFVAGEDLLYHMDNAAAPFDIAFLDIITERLNGIETAKAIRRMSDTTAIIFTTVSDQFVLSGYAVQALQYLLKPVDPSLLAAALMYDVKKRLGDQYFVFKVNAVTQRVRYDDIVYLESMLKMLKLVSTQGTHNFYALLSDVENNLPASFFRCHRGFIVNFRQVAAINSQSITTFTGHVVPIGRTYAKETNRAFLRYMAGA